jgi:hypothetical protein
VHALNKYDEVKAQIKPNHRLADFVIWGEVISRVIGNKDNEFLEAWHQNTHQQNINVIQNNPFAGLLIDYILNHHYNLIEFQMEPMQLFTELKNACYGEADRHNSCPLVPTERRMDVA